MKKAFTLLELLIVVIIIAVLVAIAAPSYYNAVEKAKDSEAKGALAELRKVFIAYQSVHGNFPSPISNGQVIEVDMDGSGFPEITVGVPDSRNYTYSSTASEIRAVGKSGTTKKWKITLSSGKLESY